MRDKLRKFILVLIILVVPGVIQAQSWYDPGWNYRMPVTIDNSSNSDPLTDYQVKVALSSVNFNFSLAQSNGEDIRFTSSDGTTLISHWIESWDAVGDSAVVWVKVPSVAALSTSDFYMYYGNTSVVDASDGSGTFEFFDDFESDYSAGSGWTPIADMPFVKADPSAAVYNDKLYVFGGYDRDTNCVKLYLNETLEYDPSTDTWTQLANMPTARWGHTAVEYNGLIHVFAGEASTGYTAAHEIYDPATDTWSAGASVPSNLVGQGLMGIKYGTKIHLFYLEFHYEYDPATDTYTQLANVPTRRTWGTCALVNDSIYVIGGFSYGTPSGPSNVNEVYDPATDTWTTKTAMPVQKYGITRENPVINGKIYVTHGLNSGFQVNNFAYDPATDTWEQKSDGINPRDGVACGVINNKLYVVGGRDLLSCAVGLTYSEVYDPVLDSGSTGNPWVVSDASVIDRDPLAQYEGLNGFLFDKASSTGDATAYSLHNHATCAVDIYWNMTDFHGTADGQPHGIFGLTGNVADGHLYYYNNGGSSDFRWYTGSFTTLQTGSWNTWFPVTIVWNGANSKVIIDGTEHAVAANAINSDRLNFRISNATRYYVDLVRVRNYSPVEPALSYGVEEQFMPLVPTLISPADLSTITDDTPQFVWSSSAGTGGTYTLQYSMNSDFSASVTTEAGLTDTTYTPTTPLPTEGSWYWHVEATNSNGSSGYQASPFSFTLDTRYPPVVIDIPDQTIPEGNTFSTINLDDFVDDPDNLDSEISWSLSGNTDLTVSIDINRVATVGIPSPDWFGSETITFTAADPDGLSDSNAATFTVNNLNDPPVVTDIPDQTIDEGQSFTTFDLDDYVTDADSAIDNLTWSYSGNTDLSVTIGVDNVVTIGIPSPDWFGSETITFRATDDSAAFSEDPATFTVNAVNDAPVVTDIPDQTIDEGQSFTTFDLDDYVSDPDDADSALTWSYSGNTELTVTIDTARVVTIGIPSADWFGSETITFRATDDSTAYDEDAATFTVNNLNDPPVVADIPDQTIDEGQSFTTFDLDDYVTDADSAIDNLTWSYSGNTDLSVTIGIDNVVTIGIPSADWFGSETITFRATDDSAAFSEDPATFTVNAVNDAPVVTDIPDQTIDEGQSFTTFDLDDYVSDPDDADSALTWSYSGNTELTVTIDTARVVTIGIPSADWFGSETITFTATDPGSLSDSDPATFTVSSVNDAPVVSDIPDQTIDEGLTFAAISLDDYVNDIDNLDSEIDWTYSGNTELTVSIDVNRIATIGIPSTDWFGSETITFTATDPSSLSDSDPATFTVNNINDAPVVSDIPDQTIDEGQSFTTFDLDDYVSDVDNPDSELSWDYTGNTQLTVTIDTANVVTIGMPSNDWFGSETITFTATDPSLSSDSDPATFTVNSVNDAPVVSDIPDQTIDEGQSFTTFDLDDYVSDVDNADADLSWSYSGNTELTVTIGVDHVVTIGMPSADWFGSETITFTATDPDLLSDSDPATFTVNNVNDAPVVSDIPDQTVAEGDPFATINLDDYVSDIDDPDADIAWSSSGAVNLSVSIDVNRIATITPLDPDWNGSETITFRATDVGGLFAEDAATFTVTPVNDAPVVSGIPDQTIDEGSTFATINLDNYVFDADNDDTELTWSKSGNSELFVDITNRVATIIIPNSDWYGTETITFRATDPFGLFGEDAAVFTVNNINDAPVVSDIPDQSIAEGATFTTISLDDYVSDIDNLDSEISWTAAGNTELLIDITARVATITVPDADWVGPETITFTATDPGLLADSDPATFTVTNINDAPVVSDIPDQTIDEGASFTAINLDDYVTDVDNSDSEISWSFSGNTDLTVTIDLDRVATISTPDPDWTGAETITFRATDDSAAYDEDAATFTVGAVNDAPVVADIPDQTIDEGGTFTTINLDDYVDDVDNLDSEMTWTWSGNTELTVSIDPSRVATISIPDADWFGAETITFTATDPGLLSDSDSAVFTVNNVNDPPVVSDIPGETVSEGTPFATISLDDYVSDIDNLDSEMTWSVSGDVNLSVSIDGSRVATITPVDPDWNGTETLTFRATDPGALFAEDGASFTITAVNDPPVVSGIPDQTVPEGSSFAQINLDDYVNDVDNLDSEMLWTKSGNVELLVDISNRVATIIIPDAHWNGSETIVFRATDPGALWDEDTAVFTVSSANDPPVVADIPDQTIDEGAAFATINLDDYVSDLDNADSEITWTNSGETDLVVTIDVNRVATIAVPNADWTGSETITFTATDPGLSSDSDPATFTVNNLNDAPVVSDIPDQTIEEGASFATINLDDYVTDVDDPDSNLTWTYAGDTDLTVTIDGSRVATISAPNPDWFGSETITFRATDDSLAFDEDAATFTITAVNDAPVVSNIPDQSIAEGSSFATIALDDYVSDVDNLDSEMTWTYSGNTELTVTIDVNRVATVTTPSAFWNGSETITFRATDPGALFDEDAATFTVSSENDPPVVSDIPDQTIDEGGTFATINLDDYVSDIDNLDSEITWTTSGEVDLTVTIDINRVATITIPDPDWTGSEAITFTATDPGNLSNSDIATFTVNNLNDAPVVSDIPDQTIAEGESFVAISLDDYVTDVDNSDDQIAWTYSGNTELTVSIANRIATITTPGADWFGAETITFRATDDSLAFDEDVATFTVTAVNDAPVVTDIPDQTIDEGGTFTTIALDDYVSDIDNLDSEMTWTYSGNTELTVSIDINRVATVTIPSTDWFGAETITFTATDPGLSSDSDPATFTVNNLNDAPVVSDIPDQSIAEGDLFATISLDDYVTDIDDPDSSIAWSYNGNTELIVTIDASRIATISTPSVDWNGSETITFRATDDSLAFSEDPATFTVTAVNDAPVVSDIPDQVVGEGTPFASISLDDYVDDVDNLDSEMTWTYSGNTELTVTIDVDRIATITTPDAFWNGSETITFRATDPGGLFDEDAATFTVSSENDPPIVSDIPDQTIDEGGTFAAINLDDYVDDIDNLDSEISWTYSGNTELNVSIDINRVATINAPSADWFGAETITFTATDPGLLSDSDPATFTVNNLNDAPVVSDIPDQTIAEGDAFATIPLDDYVEDIDNLDSEMTWTYSGNTELAVTIDLNRVATITIPGADWNGAETITFRATDDSLAFDEDAATFTVTAVNDAPVVADIPDQTVAEGTLFEVINLDDYVDDVDNLDSEMTWSYSGNIELTVDIDTNRVATITAPSPYWNGQETITFTATDPGALSDSDDAIFTVTSENDPPVVSDIPDQTIAEGDLFAAINLDDYVSDVDDPDSAMTWSYSGNIELAVSIDANRVATITTPDADWFGMETITFRATDPGGLYSDDAATFTVTNINDAPVVADIPDQTVAEGTPFATISLDNYVDDIDDADSVITWTYSGNLELIVSIDASRVATVSTPTPFWNGSETITFTATDPGALSDSDSAVFTVTSENDPPVVSGIPDQTIAEGETFAAINLDDYVDDVDDPDSVLTWTYSGNVELTVDIDLNRVATITIPDIDWNGSETIVFRATDPGALFDEDTAAFTVTAVNDAPLVEGIPDETIPDGGSFTPITLDDYVTDVDDPDSVMVWTYSGNVELIVDITDRIATITPPDPEWVGSEEIIFRATDVGGLFDEDTAVFTVTSENDPPVVESIPDQTIAEGETFATIALDDYVTDPEDDDSVIVWTYSGNVDLIVTITDRVASIATPDPDYFGTENIIFTATDPGGLSGEDTAAFTVTNVDDPPVLDSIGPKFVMETNNLNFTVTASDPDATIPQLFAENLPLNATFADSGDSTGTFDFTPDLTQSGVYTVLFYCTDGLFADSEYVEIIVNELGNQAPVFDDILPQTILEGDSLEIAVSAADPEGDSIDLLINTDLENVTFVDYGDGTGLFTLASDYFQSGVDTVTFVAIDNGDPPATRNKHVQITILDVNQPPEIDSIGPQAVLLGDSIVLHITATDSTDPDGGPLFFSALYKPSNATFIDSGTNAALFVWKPTADQIGEDTLRVICFDDEDPALSDIDTIAITVVETNQPPILDPIGPQMITEGEILELLITASDPDGPDLFLTATPLPENAEFVDSGGGVGVFTFAPSYTQSGLVSIKFKASDGILSDQENVFIQIYDNPQRPEIVVPPDTFVTEGEHLEFEISATDPDLTIPALILDNPEINVTFTDNEDGTALFEFDPAYVQAGSYAFLFIADDGVLEDSAIVNVDVLEAGNQVPQFVNAPDTVTGQETDLISFIINTVDLDSIIPNISATGVPPGAVFADSGNYNAGFSWQTVNLDVGVYPIWIFIEDGADPTLRDSTEVVVVVNELNFPPSKLFVHQIKPDSSTFPVGITAASVSEGDTLLFRLESEDPDLVPCSLSVAVYDTVNEVYLPIPSTATLVDSLNGMGSYLHVPDFDESGRIYLRFLAIDRNTLADSLHRDVTVTIVDAPQWPVIDTIPPISIVEGDSIGVQVTFSDYDSPPPSFFADSLPENAYVVNQGDPLARLFVFKPLYYQAGNYTVYFRAIDNTGRADTMTLPIEVLDAGPQPPNINVPLDDSITIREADSVMARITAIDPEGDPVTMRMEGNPAPPNAVFVDSTGGVAGFFYKPDPLHVGFTYNLDFIASDGVLEDTSTVVIKVVSFICGDANADKAVNVSDAVYIINYIFTSGPPPKPLAAADVNGSGSVNVSDAVYLINYIFTSGPPPACE